MENDQGTRRLPASDGPLKEFFGGARRCAERATNFRRTERGEPERGARAALKAHAICQSEVGLEIYM